MLVSNLISFLLKNTKYKILSIDNYSSGLKINHIKNKKVKYIKGNTKNISNYLIQKKIKLMQSFILVNSPEYIRVF